MIIQTGSVYDKNLFDTSCGFRLLVSRYWPRGVKKERVDLWLKELGAEPGLIKTWKSKSIGWKDFSTKYMRGLDSVEALNALSVLRSTAAAAAGGAIVLLCTCKEGELLCHRELLKCFLDGEQHGMYVKKLFDGE